MASKLFLSVVNAFGSVSKSSASSTLQSITGRMKLINVTTAYSTEKITRLSLEEKLGLPKKPKKPLSPYIQFQNEIRPELKKKHPEKHSQELLAIAASMWRELPDAKKVEMAELYKTELADYSKRMSGYTSSLRPDDLNQLKLAKESEKIKKQKRRLKKECKSLGKPSKPLTPFPIFVKENIGALIAKNIPRGELFRELRDIWHSKSAEEKAVYWERYKMDKVVYEKELTAWEAKMLKEGRSDLIGVPVRRVNETASLVKNQTKKK